MAGRSQHLRRIFIHDHTNVLHAVFHTGHGRDGHPHGMGRNSKAVRNAAGGRSRRRSDDGQGEVSVQGTDNSVYRWYRGAHLHAHA